MFLASFVAPFGFRYVLGVEKKKMVAGKGGGGSTSEVEMNEIKF